jgi:4-hydroxy-3-methylbut-2-enyl diphosphate reductase
MATPARPDSFEVVLVRPRGFCAGVERAIEIVDLALQQLPPPIYVRKEIVHNRAVVDRFRARGVIFVESLDEVAAGATCIFSAHGVSPAVWERARQRGLHVIDATCPLVTKVHLEVRRSVEQGKTIVLIGHQGHDEVLGTLGQAPERTVLVETVEQAEHLEVDDPDGLFYVTQTTLSVDETRDIVAALRRRFPRIEGPRKDDICYATQNRQDAVKALVRDHGVDLLLVVGSENSSNSQRLVEVARESGVPGRLLDGADALQRAWLSRARRIGLTAGASAPDDLVQDVARRLVAWGGVLREREVAVEDVVFSLPPELRRDGSSEPVR